MQNLFKVSLETFKRFIILGLYLFNYKLLLQDIFAKKHLAGLELEVDVQ